MAKDDLKITYRYQMEYFKILKELKERDKLPPSLLVMIPLLAAMEKEAV